jgi:hypothetical protein
MDPISPALRPLEPPPEFWAGGWADGDEEDDDGEE